MKKTLKVLICFLGSFSVIMFLRTTGQYNFVSFIAGMIWMVLWLGICEYLED